MEQSRDSGAVQSGKERTTIDPFDSPRQVNNANHLQLLVLVLATRIRGSTNSILTP